MIDTPPTPEWRLAGEVLRQAIEDAQGHPGEFRLNWLDIQEARSFCTDAGGEWAEARREWCDAGGFTPECFRATALRALASVAA